MVLKSPFAIKAMVQSVQKSKEFFSHLLLGLLFIILIGSTHSTSRRIRREQERLGVEIQAIHPNSVNLIWNCICTDTGRDLQCSALYWTPNGNIMHQTVVTTSVNTHVHVLHVDHLLEKTQYTLRLHCRCCSNLPPVDSKTVTFTTGSSDAVISSQQMGKIPGEIIGDRSNKSSGYNCSCDDDAEPDNQPTFYKEKSPFSSVLDTTLGVLFAVIGVVIAVVTVCYLWKGWRRRQRILQFLRPSENSDQFDIIQHNMEDSA